MARPAHPGVLRIARIEMVLLVVVLAANAATTRAPVALAQPNPADLSGASASPGTLVLSASATAAALAAASQTPTPAGQAAGSGTFAPGPTGTLAPSGSFGPGPTGVAPKPSATGTGGGAPPTPRPDVYVTIVAAGDIACDPTANVGTPTDCDQAATANLIGQLDPTAVLTLGDNQYESGTLSAFKAVFDPTWGRYRSIMYPTVGNHEYLTNRATGYFTYFGVPAYYSFDLGDWHMISIDSECSNVGGCQKGSAQETWLLADLAAHPSQCTLVYWHEPRWSSGEHQNATQMARMWEDLVAAHVDVVLTGHNHDYERFAPLDATGQLDPTGVTEFVVGTGGKNHYGFVTAPLTGELVRNDTSFGVIHMTLGPTRYSWNFVPAPGYTFQDSGSAACV